VLAAIVAVLALSAISVSALAGETTIIDGVPHVRNGSQPAAGTETLELEELWRVGGEDGEVLFGVIGQVRVDEDGLIYLLDIQLSHAEVFSPDGEHLKTLSREGDGPGEVRRPADLVLMPDGDVALLRNFPGTLIKVDRDGNPTGTVELGRGDPTAGGFVILRSGHCRGGNLVFGLTEVERGDNQAVQHRKSVLASFTPAGERLAVYSQFEYVFDFSDFHFAEAEHVDWPVRRFDLGPDGRVYCAPHRDEYRVNVYAADGTLERVIEREFEIQRRSQQELDDLRDLFEAALREIPFEYELTIEQTEPPIRWLQNGLRVAEDGSLWVLTSRSATDQPAGVMQTYDVFDADGHFMKQVAVRCDGDGADDYLFFTGHDRMVLVTGFIDAIRAMFGGGTTGEDDGEELAPMEVVCYAVRPPATATGR
jgi:hypothetical protein